jgi:hypothetical protein
MLTSTDLLHLPYTPDLTEAGIAYACRSLSSTSDRMGGSPLDRLRHIVGRVAVELAFRRYLSEQAVPFNVLKAAPFTHPDRYEVSLGGHRCDLRSFLITRRPQITRLRQDPALMLQAPALIPLEQFSAESCKPDDLYLFGFLLGLVAASQADVDKSINAGQPTYLIHPLPEQWAHPPDWRPLEKLALKSECETPITVEIGGQNARLHTGTGTPSREFVTTTVELAPKKRMPVEQCFHSLAYIHTERKPEARIGLHSPTRGEAYLVPAHEWGNIWVYGMDILLAGWITHENFRRMASVLNAGMRTMQFDRTRVKNLLVPMAELNPLAPLFERVRVWASAHENVN